MSKKLLIIPLLVICLGLAVAVFFFFVKPKMAEKKWQDLDWLLTVSVPADFDDYKKSRVEEKKTQAKQLLTDSPEDNWSWLVLGNLYEYVHDYDRAIMAYSRAIELNEFDVASVLNLATVYEGALQDYPKAEEYYKKALEINVVDPAVYISLAKMYYLKMDQPEAAEKIFIQGLKMTNNHPDLLVQVILFFQSQNQTEKMNHYIKLLLDTYPNNQLYQQKFSHFLKSN